MRNARPSYRPRGQYLPLQYTERLAQARVEPSVGRVGDSYDNAPPVKPGAGFGRVHHRWTKTEPIARRGLWRGLEAVEFATLERVHWYNHRRLLGPIGYVPPAQKEADYFRQLPEPAIAA